MQIKEFEAATLKECLQQVRNTLGPEAIILETRKLRKGGLLGWGARDAMCIVAAVGITVQNDLPGGTKGKSPRRERATTAVAVAPPAEKRATEPAPTAGVAAVSAERRERAPEKTTPSQAAALAAARAAFSRSGSTPSNGKENARVASPARQSHIPERDGASVTQGRSVEADVRRDYALTTRGASSQRETPAENELRNGADAERFASLESYMREIKESLVALHKEQERTVTAVVSATSNWTQGGQGEANGPTRFPELYHSLISDGVAEALATELIDSLPDFGAWSEQAQLPLAEAALRDLISRRVASAGPIVLTPGRLKAVALIGPTGVGKTTTIAKLAAHFSLVESKRVALLTVDTYRIAAVEQLKTYSQIIDIPIGVAYNQAEVLPAVAQFADYDLLLIDTAGRSQKNLMQVGELKTLLEPVNCETHLVLSAPIKERDMLEAAQRFAVARVDRLIFSKLDETNTYGTLLNVADQTGIPLSYLTTGQKVPEDIEIADGTRLANLLINNPVPA